MAQAKNFSIGEALKFGFNTLISNFGFFLTVNLIFVGIYIGLFVLYLLTLFLLGAFHATTMNTFSLYNVVMRNFTMFAIIGYYALLSFILKEYYLFVMTRSGLTLYDGKPVSWKAMRNTKNFFNFFCARLLFGAKYFLGALLFIIPGVYLFCKYYFSGFFLLDEKAQAIGQDSNLAAELTTGVRWKILGFHIVNSLLMALAAFTIIGALFAPAFLLSAVHVYRTLGKAEQETPTRLN